MAPSYTSNEENKKENIEVEVGNVQPSRDEESLDIDGSSVEAEASAPNKCRSFCSGKILVFGGLLAASFFVISGLAVDNAAKSELIQAAPQSSVPPWPGSKASKTKSGKGKSGKMGKPAMPDSCDHFVGWEADDEAHDMWGVISGLNTCAPTMPAHACCFDVQMAWGDLTIDLAASMFDEVLSFQGCIEDGSVAGVIDMHTWWYNVAVTSSDAYVDFAQGFVTVADDADVDV